MISAQQLPKINTDKPNSIVDPQVWVEIHGVSIDKARAKTQRIDNNGEKIFCYWTYHVVDYVLHKNLFKYLINRNISNVLMVCILI